MTERTERPATQREHVTAMRIAAPIAFVNGLVHMATQVAHLMPPPTGGYTRVVQPFLLLQLVSARYQRVTTPGQPAPALWPPESG
jgi:hypothetical protein